MYVYNTCLQYMYTMGSRDNGNNRNNRNNWNNSIIKIIQCIHMMWVPYVYMYSQCTHHMWMQYDITYEYYEYYEYYVLLIHGYSFHMSVMFNLIIQAMFRLISMLTHPRWV